MAYAKALRPRTNFEINKLFLFKGVRAGMQYDLRKPIFTLLPAT